MAKQPFPDKRRAQLALPPTGALIAGVHWVTRFCVDSSGRSFAVSACGTVGHDFPTFVPWDSPIQAAWCIPEIPDAIVDCPACLLAFQADVASYVDQMNTPAAELAAREAAQRAEWRRQRKLDKAAEKMGRSSKARYAARKAKYQTRYTDCHACPHMREPFRCGRQDSEPIPSPCPIHHEHPAPWVPPPPIPIKDPRRDRPLLDPHAERCAYALSPHERARARAVEQGIVYGETKHNKGSPLDYKPGELVRFLAVPDTPPAPRGLSDFDLRAGVRDEYLHLTCDAVPWDVLGLSAYGQYASMVVDEGPTRKGLTMYDYDDYLDDAGTFEEEVEIETPEGDYLLCLEVDSDAEVHSVFHASRVEGQGPGVSFVSLEDDAADELLQRHRALVEAELVKTLRVAADVAAADHYTRRAESGWGE